MASFANRMGFKFFPDELAAPPAFMEDENLALFDKGLNRRAYNVLTDRAGGVEIHVFDYAYTAGERKNSREHRLTVAVFSAPDGAYPIFLIEPKGVFDKLDPFTERGAVDLEEYPGFSKSYSIDSLQDVQSLKAALHGVFGLLALEAGWHMQSSRQNVLFFKNTGLVPIGEYEDFVRKCRSVFGALNGNLTVRL